MKEVRFETLRSAKPHLKVNVYQGFYECNPKLFVVSLTERGHLLTETFDNQMFINMSVLSLLMSYIPGDRPHELHIHTPLPVRSTY